MLMSTGPLDALPPKAKLSWHERFDVKWLVVGVCVVLVVFLAAVPLHIEAFMPAQFGLRG